MNVRILKTHGLIDEAKMPIKEFETYVSKHPLNINEMKFLKKANKEFEKMSCWWKGPKVKKWLMETNDIYTWHFQKLKPIEVKK